MKQREFDQSLVDRTHFFLRLEDECWICRTSSQLTREHKFKASDLRREFGNEKMAKFHQGDWSAQTPQFMYSAKSKNAQFRPSICNHCNSAQTQRHDAAYVLLSDRISTLMSEGTDPRSIIEEQPWSNPYDELTLNSLRYLAKLIGCHCAEVGAPIPQRLTEFVAEKMGFSPVRCEITEAESWKVGFQHFEAIEEDISHVAHFGLAVMFDRTTGAPTGYRSGIRLRWTDLNFFFDFHDDEIAELTTAYGDFLSYARANVDEPWEV